MLTFHRCGLRLASTAAAAATLLISQPAPALTLQVSEDDSKLNKTITLHLGAVTVSQVAAELSRQSGLSVEAGAAVKDRLIQVEISGMTVRQALDAIADLYDWRWYRRNPGVYALDRRVFHAPRDPAAIPAEMQAALPRDMRVFLRLPDLETKKPDYTSGVASMQVGRAAAQSLNRLHTDLLPTLMKQEKLAVHDMPSAQRDDLITWLTFVNIKKTMELLHDDPAPHKMNARNITLRIEQNFDLSIDTTPDVVPGFAFGTQFQFPDGRWVP